MAKSDNPGAHTARTEGPGANMNDFIGGKNRYRGGIVGRFGSGEQSGSKLSGTFYRSGMPSPVQGSSPAMSTFLTGKRKPSGGVNFFTYGQSIKGTGPGNAGTRDALAKVGGGDGSSGNDGYGGGSLKGGGKITGFTTNISRGYTAESDFGGDANGVFAVANQSYYKQNFDQDGGHRYGDYTKGLQGVQSNNAFDGSAGGVSYEGRSNQG